METQAQFEARLRATDDYQEAIGLMEAITAIKAKLALLEASLKQTGEAGQLARLDVMQKAMQSQEGK